MSCWPLFLRLQDGVPGDRLIAPRPHLPSCGTEPWCRSSGPMRERELGLEEQPAASDNVNGEPVTCRRWNPPSCRGFCAGAEQNARPHSLLLLTLSGLDLSSVERLLLCCQGRWVAPSFVVLKSDLVGAFML